MAFNALISFESNSYSFKAIIAYYTNKYCGFIFFQIEKYSQKAEVNSSESIIM